jgi:lipopolysaccharide transport system permease protein
VSVAGGRRGRREIVIAPPRGLRRLELGELWEHRHLAAYMAWRDVKVRYRQTLISVGWSVIQPVSTTLLFVLVFHRLANLSTDGLAAPVFYLSGVVTWGYFSTALSAASNSVVNAQHLVGKVYFPRTLLPISAILPGLLDLGVSLLVLGGVMLVYRVAPGVWLPLLPLYLLLVAAATLGAGLWLAALNAFYRDVKYVLPFVLQLLIFVVPVAYPISALHGALRWLFALDPIAVGIVGVRWTITGRSPPTVMDVGLAVVETAAVLLGGALFFRHLEARLGDVV